MLKTTKVTELTMRMLRMLARARGELQATVLERLVAKEFVKPEYLDRFRQISGLDLTTDYDPQKEAGAEYMYKDTISDEKELNYD